MSFRIIWELIITDIKIVKKIRKMNDLIVKTIYK